MTERSHGLVLGRFTAGFIGLVAMAALVTGAVAAANAPSPKVVVADATAATTSMATDTATAKPIAKLEITEDPSAEASEHASSSPESTAKPIAKAAASCDPSLDVKEDLLEASAKASAKAQNGDNDADDLAPGATAAPKVLKAPEASEPPSCHKADTDGDGDKPGGDKPGGDRSGGKPPVQVAGARNGNGFGHSGDAKKGAFTSGFTFFGRR